MEPTDPETRWQAAFAALGSDLHAWRVAHPHASFTEIEAAVDARLDPLRAQLMQDTILASPAARLGTTAAERPRCPECGQPLARRGIRTRTVTVRGNQPL